MVFMIFIKKKTIHYPSIIKNEDIVYIVEYSLKETL